MGIKSVDLGQVSNHNINLADTVKPGSDIGQCQINLEVFVGSMSLGLVGLGEA